MEDLKTLHDQSLQAAGQAKKAVERNSMMLQQKIAERTKLLSQLEQAKMQEQAANSLRQMTELSAPGSTPSLEDVRDKIERRYANAIGQAELAQNSVQGRMLEVQESTIDMAGQNRLEQIRASLRGAPGRRRGHGGPARGDAAVVRSGPGGPADHAPGAAARHELIAPVTPPTPSGWAAFVSPGAAGRYRRERAVRAAAPCRGAGDGPGWHRGHQ